MDRGEKCLSSLDSAGTVQPCSGRCTVDCNQPSASNFSPPTVPSRPKACQPDFVSETADIGFVYDEDSTLDAFDREVLSERPQEMIWRASQGRSQVSFPFSAPVTPVNREVSLHDRKYLPFWTPTHESTTSSSPTISLSSPSIQPVKNRAGPQAPSSLAATSRRIISPSQIQNGAPYGCKQAGSATPITLSHTPLVVRGIALRQPSALPDQFRSLFTFETFNAVQSKCFPAAFETDENLVLSAPTGSGKTVVMELAICRIVVSSQGEDFKVIYQAPTKSLCSERFRDWQAKFGSLGLQCAELTGDTDFHQLRNVQNASIIITTPEKWDSVTRKWKDHARLMALVKLFLIDEVHILKHARGATLEAVVSRMKSVGSNVRFVALSATVPNSEDIAKWLGRSQHLPHLPAHREVFGEEFRPVQLQKFVYGYSVKQNDFIFDNILTNKLPEIIAKHSRRKPILIFCFTRTSAIQTSKSLAELFNATNQANRPWLAPKKRIRVLNEQLQHTTSAGVAFHHAGLDLADRRAVEDGFSTGDINIICCTSTLAVGVNLPCYLVVIKNTVAWAESGVQEYADLEMMQMLGRAGRPQFESSACAVILTRHERVNFYEQMISGKEQLESSLHLNLIDHLNAEIGLGTVYDMPSAKKWLAGTFLFVRLQRNRNHYRLEENAQRCDEDELLERICEKDVQLLQDVGLISNESQLKCTEFGDAMARYCIKFETMKAILALPPKAKISEILPVVTTAAEFHEIRLRAAERSLYKEINKDIAIKFPIKVDIALPAQKVSLLIQSELGGLEYPAHDGFKKHKQQYQQDKGIVFQHVNRIIRCIIDCQLHLHDSVSARHALELGRSLGAKVWDNSPLQMKQIDQIGDIAARKLAGAGIKSLADLENTDSHKIEAVVSRNPPFGLRLLSKLAEFPKLRVSVKQLGKETRKGQYVEVKISTQIGFLNQQAPSFFHRKPIWVCFLAETANGTILDFRRVGAKVLQTEHEIIILAQLRTPTSHISCHVMCDGIAGTARCAHLDLNHIPSGLFPVLKPTIEQKQPREGPTTASENRRRYTNEAFQDFDDICDGGLDDGDLLNFVQVPQNIEVLDIDDFLGEDLTAELHWKALRQVDQHAAKDDSDSMRFDNGRWACNHTCRKERKECKHRCCAEGLEKPRKPRPKKATLESPDEVQQPGSNGERRNPLRTSRPNLGADPTPSGYSGLLRTESVSKLDDSSNAVPCSWSQGIVRQPRKLGRLEDSSSDESVKDDDPFDALDLEELFSLSEHPVDRYPLNEQPVKIRNGAEVTADVERGQFEVMESDLPTLEAKLRQDEAPETTASGFVTVKDFQNPGHGEVLLRQSVDEGRGCFGAPLACVKPSSLRKGQEAEGLNHVQELTGFDSWSQAVDTADTADTADPLRHPPFPHAMARKRGELAGTILEDGDAGIPEELPRKRRKFVDDKASERSLTLPFPDLPDSFMSSKELKETVVQDGMYNWNVSGAKEDNADYEARQRALWEEAGGDLSFYEDFKDYVELI